MRMQSILVKPYVLKCLERYEKEHLEEDKKQPKKIIELEATKRRMSELNQQMMKEKKMKALQKENGKGLDEDGEETKVSDRDEYESSNSSDDEIDEERVDLSKIIEMKRKTRLSISKTNETRDQIAKLTKE